MILSILSRFIYSYRRYTFFFAPHNATECIRSMFYFYNERYNIITNCTCYVTLAEKITFRSVRGGGGGWRWVGNKDFVRERKTLPNSTDHLFYNDRTTSYAQNKWDLSPPRPRCGRQNCRVYSKTSTFYRNKTSRLPNVNLSIYMYLYVDTRCTSAVISVLFCVRFTRDVVEQI